jgi:hypothetical protein
MSSEFLVLVLLIAGFVAAPFASLSDRARLPRIAATVLLMAVLAILGYFGFAFDRGYLLPEAWEACAFFVSIGVVICLLVYKRHRFGLALILGGALVVAVTGLHLFAMDFVRTCQRACVRVQEGMNAEQVRSIVSAEFVNCSAYRVVTGPADGWGNRDGYMSIDLRPLYADLEPGSIQVEFVNGRANKAWTSAVHSPLSVAMIWELIGSVVLITICAQRLCSTTKAGEMTAVITFDVLEERLQRIREQHYLRQAPDRSVLTKRTLIHCAGQRIRQLAFFDCRAVECQSDVQPKL